MDAAQFQIWREDFRREVEQVLCQMRSAQAASPEAAATVLFPGDLAAMLAREKARCEALARELEKARAELSRQAAALERERRRRERLRQLCGKLAWAVKNRGPRD